MAADRAGPGGVKRRQSAFFDAYRHCVAIAGILVLLGFCAVTAVLLRAVRANELRCYYLKPPLVQIEREILSEQAFACSTQLCRFTFRFSVDRGLTCFLPRILDRGSEGIGQAVQIPGAHWVYRRWLPPSFGLRAGRSGF